MKVRTCNILSKTSSYSDLGNLPLERLNSLLYLGRVFSGHFSFPGLRVPAAGTVKFEELMSSGSRRLGVAESAGSREGIGSELLYINMGLTGGEVVIHGSK